MKTSELSRATGVKVETIRFYELQGLLPKPKRLPNGYRTYSARHVERLGLIRRCRAVDMSLAEVRLIVSFMAEPAGSCQDVSMLVESQLEKLRVRLKALRALERELSRLRQECEPSRTHRNCAILRGLVEERT